VPRLKHKFLKTSELNNESGILILVNISSGGGGRQAPPCCGYLDHEQKAKEQQKQQVMGGGGLLKSISGKAHAGAKSGKTIRPAGKVGD
jgi:hypothetical protein